jgi:hypothetical protein
VSLLERIQGPGDLKALPASDVPALADEIRQFLVDRVSRTGGHLGPNLGVVELTIALHYCFDFEKDRLLWDVGHQCYAHKILTGRPPTVTIRPISTGIKAVDHMALMEVAWYSRQLHRMANGKDPRPDESGLSSFIKTVLTSGYRTFKTRRLRA